MKKTLIVVNEMSGNASKVNVDELCRIFTDDEITLIRLTNKEQDYSVDGFDKLVVCGGDGTVNNAVNKCKDKKIDVFCVPTGTLNEKASVRQGKLESAGTVNHKLFSYVLAAGSFTEIGYTAQIEQKKKYKLFAYLGKVRKAYKIFDMEGKIETNGQVFAGEYTLVMVLDSDRCFGFSFNKRYDPKEQKLYFLLIKAPQNKGFYGKIQMFFPFFRAFFIGFKKEYHSENIDFFTSEKALISLKNEEIFCVDGEKRTFGKELLIEKKPLTPNVFILNACS